MAESLTSTASPGFSLSSGKYSITDRTTWGMDPRWPGVKLPWASIRPRRSKIAVEKSSPSRTASEKAVCRRVVPISSAMETKPPQITESVMGSTGRLPRAASVMSAHSSYPTSITMCPDGPTVTVSPGRTTVVDSRSSTIAGPANASPSRRR